MKFLVFLGLLFLMACTPDDSKRPDKKNLIPYDSHVHIMSPFLIKRWKDMGIPFSHEVDYYSNIDNILTNVGAQKIDLIGMAYIYGNPVFYSGKDGYEQVIKENNYLLKAAQKYPHRIRPFYGIDPLRDYAAEEIQRCLDLSANAGIKFHFNTSQIFLTDQEHSNKVKSIFNLVAANKRPVLLHYDNSDYLFGAPDVNILVDSILHDLPAIHITFAHFGAAGPFSDKTKKVLDAFINHFQKNNIPQRHTLQFDISAVALDKDSDGIPPLEDHEYLELKGYIEKLGIERIIFGTDYPLYTGNEYLDVLRNKLKLDDDELEIILNH